MLITHNATAKAGRRWPGPPRHSALPVIVLATLFLCWTGRGAAETGQNRLSYGAHAGYAKPSGSSKGSWFVGPQLEVRPTPFLGIQGAVDYRSHAPYAATPAMTNAVKVRSIPVTLTGKLYLPMPSSMAPYLLGGAGWYRVTYDFSPAFEQEFNVQDRSVSTFGWHLGAGAKFMLVPNLSVTGEFRYVFVDPARKLGPEVRDQIRNLDYNSTYLGLGVNIEM